MNKEYIYTTVLKKQALETIFSEVEDFMNKHRENLRSITPAQWNALRSFCLRKNNIGQIKEYLKRKMERRGNPWYGSSARKVADSLISKFELIEKEGLKEAEDKALITLDAANKKCFKQNWVSPELSPNILYKLKLQQIQTFVSVLVKEINLKEGK
ncbi:MAG: hypothetical protein H8D26_07665 [Methanomicrobia archaeon]|nr:hypothetical protein [Methanomicrobia archaeon]